MPCPIYCNLNIIYWVSCTVNQLHQHQCCESFCDLRLGKTINNRFGNCIVHTGKNTYTNHNLNYCFLQGLWTLFQLGFVPYYTYRHCVKKYSCLVGIGLNDYYHFQKQDDCAIWQYGLWSFQTGDTKLERFLPKN